MQFIPQVIPDILLITPKIHEDKRGYFFEQFRKSALEQVVGHSIEFVQDSESRSAKGVFRGLHFQLSPYSQSKLVRVIEGQVLDVSMDIRMGSPHYGKCVTALLSSQNKHQLFIPRGFAHGFLVLSDYATLNYRLDNYYAPEYERGVSIQGLLRNFDWVENPEAVAEISKLSTKSIEISARDENFPSLEELENSFNYTENYYA